MLFVTEPGQALTGLFKLDFNRDERRVSYVELIFSPMVLINEVYGS